MEKTLSAIPDLMTFNITSGLLRTYKDPDGQKRLKTVASSTIKDRGGDVMTENAIRRMADSARENMTIFLNHSYSVPEDVFGSVEDVEVVRRGDVWDLDFDIRLNESNPRALRTYEAIENGTKLGTSIGARIREDGAKRDKSSGGWVFDDIELLEASIVGIPANPRSWVEHALKSLTPDMTEAKVWINHDMKSGSHSVTVDTDADMESTMEDKNEDEKTEKPKKRKDDEPEVVQADELEVVKADGLDDSIDWSNLPEGDEAEATALMAEYDELDKSDVATDFIAFATDEELLIKAPLSGKARSNLSDSQFACPEKRKYPIHDKAHIRAALSRCGDPSNDQCGCDRVKAAARRAGIGGDSSSKAERDANDLQNIEEPDLTKDADPAVPDATSPVAQEGQLTGPEAASDGESPETITESFTGILDLLKATMDDLVSVRKQLLEETGARGKAEGERDQAQQELGKAKEIIDAIAELPVGRRSGFESGVREFRTRFSSLYSEDFLKMLEKPNDA